MIRFGVLLSLALVAGTFPAAAQPLPLPLPFDMRGTPEDQRACRPDAVKLCRDVLASNDNMAVLRCFQGQRSKLSPACRAVLQKYGQ